MALRKLVSSVAKVVETQVRVDRLSSTMKRVWEEEVSQNKLGVSLVLAAAGLVGHKKSEYDDVKKLRAQLHQILADCEIVLLRCDANSQAFRSTEAKMKKLKREIWLSKET
ncbi:Uncharacterized protein Rs2_12977 [Raphanus sativus]|uniref:Uncharacterized protein LOC108836438 isoform X2 n=1 Tax=Raphanus sativus TaxID=3726 RepID=A0A6J0LYE5_RAPSA|nr:uncharacterized protein LOC108836438 isoform X2 [Raphanus sativus]KAJ4899026.1 Uncharacterized protein Rs2_12977 [Raphanus sativus]